MPATAATPAAVSSAGSLQISRASSFTAGGSRLKCRIGSGTWILKRRLGLESSIAQSYVRPAVDNSRNPVPVSKAETKPFINQRLTISFDLDAFLPEDSQRLTVPELSTG